MKAKTILRGKVLDSQRSYQAVRNGGAGVLDLTSRGRILVGGSEAITFLNGLITNDMKTLPRNRWMPAAFPNVQGRLIAAVRVMRLADDAAETKTNPRFLLDTEATTHQKVLQTIERFTMAGDFIVKDITSDTSMFSLQGRQAFPIARLLLEDPIADLATDEVTEMKWKETDITLLHASHTAEDGVDVVVATKHASELFELFVNAGAVPVEHDELETLRIEAGVGRFGQDMDETNVVTEANLDDAVSFTKGCYIGQEIIARIKYRGHVAKKLSGLTFEGEQVVERGAVITTSEGRNIGRITSVTFSPQLSKTIALGYVRYEYLAPGTEVFVSENVLNATVTQLPFVRGSWYQ